MKMNNLESKIDSLGIYFDGMLRLPEGKHGVRVVVPEGWVMYEKKGDDYKISPFVVNDNNVRKILFVGDKNVKITEIMDFAYEVIMNNLENEKKKELFEVRVKDLAKIFDTNQLSKLENLVFKFEKPKKEKKEQTIDNKKNKTDINDISDENIDEFDEIRKLAEQKD